jgi:hypothetical protein
VASRVLFSLKSMYKQVYGKTALNQNFVDRQFDRATIAD